MKALLVVAAVLLSGCGVNLDPIMGRETTVTTTVTQPPRVDCDVLFP